MKRNQVKKLLPAHIYLFIYKLEFDIQEILVL